MPCYYPLRAWKGPGKTGALSITFTKQGSSHNPLELPCGQCIGCRLERSRQWALRCMHEASLYSDNCFLTLTYSDPHLPLYNSLRFRDFQLFMKRFRKLHGSGIRFFHCGEYGEGTSRPHYHALIFNFDFDDKVLYSETAQGHRLYTSKGLDSLWGLGECKIGALTFESAAYVARYCVKKITGADADRAYEVIDAGTGEVVGRRQPEYATMSRRPGIGGGWYERYASEVYPSDFVVRDGRRMRPPKAYDRKLAVDDPSLLQRLQAKRVRAARRFRVDQTDERLAVREEVKLAQASTLKRKL